MKMILPRAPFSSRTDPPAVNYFPVSAKTRSSRASTANSGSIKVNLLQQKTDFKAAAIRYIGTPFPSQSLDTSPAKSISESVASVASVPESISELRTLWLESDNDSEGEISVTGEEIREYQPVTNEDRIQGLGICLNPRHSPMLLPDQLGNSSTTSASPAHHLEDDADAPYIKRSLTPHGLPVRHYYHASPKLEDCFHVERPSSINLFRAPVKAQCTSNATDKVAVSRPAPLQISRKPIAAYDARAVLPISPAPAFSRSSTSTKSSSNSAKASTIVNTGETTPDSVREQASAAGDTKEKTYNGNAWSLAIVPDRSESVCEVREKEFAEEQNPSSFIFLPANDFKDQKSDKQYRPPALISESIQAELFQKKTLNHGEGDRHERFPHGSHSNFSSRQWIYDSSSRLGALHPKPKGRRQEIQFGPRLLKSASLDHLRPAPPPKLPILDEDTIHPAHRTGPYFNSADRVILAETPIEETPNRAFPPAPSTPCDPRRKHHRPAKPSSALRGYGTTKLEPTYEVEARLSTWESSPDFGSAESSDSSRQIKTKASSPTLGTPGPRLLSFNNRPQLNTKASLPTLGTSEPKFPSPCPQVRVAIPKTSSGDLSCHPPGSHYQTPSLRLHSPVPHPFSPSPRGQNLSPYFQNPRTPPRSPDNARLPPTRHAWPRVAQLEVYIPTGAPITPAAVYGRRQSLRRVGSTIGQVSGMV